MASLIESPFALLAVHGGRIAARSENVVRYLGPGAADAARLHESLPDAVAHQVALALESRIASPVWLPTCDTARELEISVHVAPDGLGLVELEPQGTRPDGSLRDQLDEAEIEALCEAAGEPASRLASLLDWLRGRTEHTEALLFVPVSEDHLEVVASSRAGESGLHNRQFIRVSQLPLAVRRRVMGTALTWIEDVHSCGSRLVGEREVLSRVAAGGPSCLALPADARTFLGQGGARSVVAVSVHRQQRLGAVLVLRSEESRAPCGALRRLCLRVARRAHALDQERRLLGARNPAGDRATRFFDLAARIAGSGDALGQLINDRLGLHRAFDEVDACAIWTEGRILRSPRAPDDACVVELAAALERLGEDGVFSTSRADRLVAPTMAAQIPRGLLTSTLADGRARFMLFRGESGLPESASADSVAPESRPWTDADRELAVELALGIDRLSVVPLELTRAANQRMAAMLAHAEVLDTALRLTGHAVVTCELDGTEATITDVGAAFEELTGYGAQEAIGRDPRFLQGPDTSAEARRQFRAAVERHAPLDIRVLNYRRDGTPWWNDIQLRPLPTIDGQPQRMIAVQRNAEPAMQAEREEARAAEDRVLNLVTRGIAHDLSNLLMAVGTSLSLLEDDPRLDTDDQQLIAQTMLASERARLMLASLRASAKAEAQPPVPVDLDAELRSMRPLCTAAISPSSRIELELRAGDGLALASPGLLHGAVLNLVLNADRAMPRGGVIRLRTRRVDDDRHPYLLEVEDHGEGMDAETLARATEPFFTSRRRRGGTGLGLTMVRRFADGAGAQLQLESELGKGTVVRLAFRSAEMDGAAANAHRNS